jgi:hypothetical protein
VLLGLLPGCELFGAVPLLGLVLLGVEPLLGRRAAGQGRPIRGRTGLGRHV